MEGGARSWSLSACGTEQNGLVHAVHGAAHGVGACHRALVVLSWAGACRTGVVVVHIATMRAALVPVLKMFDRRGVASADTISATVCATVTVVAAAAAAVCILGATMNVASAAAVRGLIATVVVSTTTIVATASVAATTTIVAAALLSTAASATWALLVVADTWGGLAIAEGLAEHLELPLDCCDVGRVGLE